MQSVLPLEAQKRMLVEVFLANPNFIQERYITTNYFLKGREGVKIPLLFLLETCQTLETISCYYGCYGKLYQYD